jgi:hypothetical protein
VRWAGILFGVALWSSVSSVARADSAQPTCHISFGVNYSPQIYRTFDGTITMDPATNDFTSVSINSSIGDNWSGPGGYYGNVASIYFPFPRLTLYFDPTLGTIYYLGGVLTLYPRNGSIQCDPPAQQPSCDVFVQHVYADYFGYPPSDQSRAFYVQACQAGHDTPKVRDYILLHLYQSSSGQATFYNSQRFNCGDLVMNLYRMFLRRQPNLTDPTYAAQASFQCRSPLAGSGQAAGLSGLAGVAQDIIGSQEYARKHNPSVMPPDWNALCSAGGIQNDGSCSLAATAPAAPVSPPVPTTPTNPECGSGESPVYRFGFAALSQRLAGQMGQPRSCEYADPSASGDTLQDTEKGLAFYRRSTNTPTFTNGKDHWALSISGLLHWTGDSIDPPMEAELVQG